jgi:hypothetical protein
LPISGSGDLVRYPNSKAIIEIDGYVLCIHSTPHRLEYCEMKKTTQHIVTLGEEQGFVKRIKREKNFKNF